MTPSAPSPQDQERLNLRLSNAVDGFRFDEVRRLLAAGADPNFRRKGYEPMLSFVAAYDSALMVGLMIAHGADVHACDDDGQTALAAALDTAEMESALLLMKHGASLNQQQVAGVTPPPYVAAILADKGSLSTARTSFILRHQADLSLTFTYKSRAGSTVAEVIADLRATADHRNRATVEQVCFMLEQALAARARQLADTRQKHERVQRRQSLHGKRRGDFKL